MVVLCPMRGDVFSGSLSGGFFNLLPMLCAVFSVVFTNPIRVFSVVFLRPLAAFSPVSSLHYFAPFFTS